MTGDHGPAGPRSHGPGANADAAFADAARNHLSDALQMSHAQRWRWLQDAIEQGFLSARARGKRDLVTLGPHGEVIWSPMHERIYSTEHRLPTDAELAEQG